MDVVASLYGRNSLLELVNYIADIIFIPLTVGGGIRSVEDIKKLLRAGADKVAINTAAINNPNLIKEAAQRFGSQCIVISVEAKRVSDSKYECFTDNGRERTGIDVLTWCQRVQELGAGEILLTSVDFEGTGLGYDVRLTRLISESVSIPVIACGGCGNTQHIINVIHEGKADAVAAASIFHYEKLRKIIDGCLSREYPEGNLNYLKDCYEGTIRGRRNIAPASIKEVKGRFLDYGIVCRQ
jgi:cyclase